MSRINEPKINFKNVNFWSVSISVFAIILIKCWHFSNLFQPMIYTNIARA